VGLIAAWPPVADWLRYRYVYHVPLAVLAAAAVISSFLAFTAALILDGLADHSRRTFELNTLSGVRDPTHPARTT
jgi:hypothetical protein